MPKQVWKIDNFDGGLNNKADPRDVKDNQLIIARDVDLSSGGRIMMLGKFVAHDAGTISGVTVEPGYGLHYFSHDRLGATIKQAEWRGTHTGSDGTALDLSDSAASYTADELIGYTVYNATDLASGGLTTSSGECDDNGTNTINLSSMTGGTDNDWDQDDVYVLSAPETGDDYLIQSDSTNHTLGVYSRVNDRWVEGVIDIGSTNSAKPCFYDVDGAVRISDGNFGAGNRNKWFGYINRTKHFLDSSGAHLVTNGTPDTYEGWYVYNTDLAAPTSGIYGKVAFTATSGSNTTTIDSSATIFKDMDDELDKGTYFAIANNNSKAARVITARTDNDTIVTETNSDNWASEAIRVYPPIGTGFNIGFLEDTSTEGSWPAKSYEIGTTFIYIGNQESNVYKNIGDSDGHAIGIGNSISLAVYATSYFEPNIIGGRVYLRESGSDDPWILLLDVRLREGIRTSLTGDFIGWTLQDTDTESGASRNDMYVFAEATVSIPSPWTYESINGYGPEESISIGGLGEGFKTAVVANRQVYVGNVRRQNEHGETITEGDAMYKSMPGKFDTFPLSRKIVASVQDGDEIIKLAEYADRILQFKKNKLHIINISQDAEFLEDTFMFKGVSHPSAVCKTDYGIAWANYHGCYLYDGKSVRNLLERDGLRVIDEDLWDMFVTGTTTVAYMPRQRKILVGRETRGNNTITGGITPNNTAAPVAGSTLLKKEVSPGDSLTINSTTARVFSIQSDTTLKLDSTVATGSEDTSVVVTYSGDMYLYDMVSQTWTFGDSKLIDGEKKTNFIVDWNNDLVLANENSSGNSYIGKWADVSVQTAWYRVETKDIDFGFPGVRKKIYRVRISYKGDGRNLQIRYATDGGENWANFNDDNTPITSDVGTASWSHLNLKPTASVNNIYSFRIAIYGDGTNNIPAGFEINDISIIYRLKNVK